MYAPAPTPVSGYGRHDVWPVLRNWARDRRSFDSACNVEMVCHVWINDSTPLANLPNKVFLAVSFD